MKIINRIIYAIIIALGLYLTIDITHARVAEAYIRNKGNEALNAEDYDFFVSARYYYATPIINKDISFEHYEFKLLIYNVANVISGDDYNVIEGFQILLFQTKGPAYTHPHIGKISTSSNDIVIERRGRQILDLPVYILTTPLNTSTFINKNLLFIEDIFFPVISYELLNEEGLLVSKDISINEEDFKLTLELEKYIEEFENLPQTPFGNVKIAPVIRIDSSAESIKNALIYLSISAVLTYVLFFFRRNKGSKPATEGLKKDVEKLYKQHQEKR